jgi:hypothetical protein
MRPIAVIVCVGLVVGLTCGQTDDGLQAIDECGVLVQGPDCTLFEGAGGAYVVPDAGGFKVGDAVRVIGTLDPACVTICTGADGCIRGAVVYDPAVFPCGSHVPSFPEDLITGICTAASAGLLALSLAGMWHTRRR